MVARDLAAPTGHRDQTSGVIPIAIDHTHKVAREAVKV
jgi:hypothetical protein